MKNGLELSLIGSLRLVRGGAEVDLPASRKTRALLAFLAVADRPVRREHLCDLLWEVPDDPRGALRWSLSKLRPLVDVPGRCELVADRETVRLDCAGMEIDWRRLRSLATRDVSRASLATLAEQAARDGVFLEGLDLPACEGFQAWLTAMREEVRRWRVVVLRALCDRITEPEQALAHARTLVALDPFDAPARVLLVDLLDRTGRREEAELQRETGIRKLGEAAVPIPAALRPAGRKPIVEAASPAREDAGPDAGKSREPPEPLAGAQQVRLCSAHDGTGLAYSIVGDGPPLVKAANWMSHLEFDWNSPVWRHWIAHFLPYRQLVRYDERGNGLSDWEVDDIGFEAFVDDLESVVDAAGLESFDLFGVSQGCAVSIAYAVRHPERVRKLILFGGYAAGWRTRASAEEVARREAMLTLTRTGWGSDNPAFRQMFSTLFFPKADPADIGWFNELQRVCVSPENAIRFQDAFSIIDVRDLLPQVAAPTLVLHASRDAVVPFSAGRELAARIPGAQFVALDSDNHLLLENEPAWQRVTTVMRDFLGKD